MHPVLELISFHVCLHKINHLKYIIMRKEKLHFT